MNLAPNIVTHLQNNDSFSIILFYLATEIFVLEGK